MIRRVVGIIIPRKYLSVIRYLIIGGSAFGLDLGLLIVFRSGFHIPLYIAATLSYIFALCYNFVLNRSWTFGARGGIRVHLVLYCILVVINYLVTLALLDWLGRFGVPYELAKILSIFPILGWNYLAYRYIFTIHLRIGRSKKNATAEAAGTIV